VRYWLYAAVLVAGAAFSILFTGDVYNEPDTGFGDLSVVSIIAGDRAFLPLLFAAAVGALVGSAGRWRFVLLFRWGRFIPCSPSTGCRPCSRRASGGSSGTGSATTLSGRRT
jgi:hypothetical protein